MAQLAQLDHAVINVRYQMDEAEKCFRDLGFHVTERGYHTLGSINHLMVFEADYMELIGLPEPPTAEKPGRPDIVNAPVGINGLVFKTLDADETFAHLQAIGMAGNPPNAFSRPIEVAGGTADVRFRTAHLPPGLFPGGRIYFCEHGTPDLVWRREWQNHANGARSMSEFVVVSENHRKEAEDFARLLRSDVAGAGDHLSVKLDGAAITLLSPAAYRDRYGDLASALAGRNSFFGAIVLRATDLAGIRRIAAAGDNPASDESDRVVVHQQAFDTVLEFVRS